MKIIFCGSPLNFKEVDPDFIEEYNAAKEAGFTAEIMNLEELIQNGNINKCLKLVKESNIEESIIYRGWMMKPIQYETFYNGLVKKGNRLINNPIEYKLCHYLPENYNIIENYTPKSVWLEKNEIRIDTIMDKIELFKGKSLILKDYVKSQKHRWKEACFIENSGDRADVERVVNNFIKCQGDELNDGIVFREFVELEFLTNHSKSNMPITKEYRLFFVNNKLMSVYNYWNEGVNLEEEIPLDSFVKIANLVKSNFFTMDIAKQRNGDWTIIELGDGQVSGVPENIDKKEFYRDLYKSMF